MLTITPWGPRGKALKKYPLWQIFIFEALDAHYQNSNNVTPPTPPKTVPSGAVILKMCGCFGCPDGLVAQLVFRLGPDAGSPVMLRIFLYQELSLEQHDFCKTFSSGFSRIFSKGEVTASTFVPSHLIIFSYTTGSAVWDLVRIMTFILR